MKSTPEMTRNTVLLIVDDSRVSRMMIRGRVVAAHPDWTIFEAGNAQEALDSVQAHTPDFISMDVNMPGLSGFEAIAQIRAVGSKARIAMLTANIQQSSRDRAAEMGVYFVQKPATEAAVHIMLAYFNGAA
jgi:CheY-like chemotaxis protein